MTAETLTQTTHLETVATSELNHDELTPQLASDLLFLSFEHAQGFPLVQRNLLELIRESHPSWNMSDDLLAQTKKLVAPRIGDVLRQTQRKAGTDGSVIHPDPESISKSAEELNNRLRDMQEAFNGERIPGNTKILDITRGMFQRDAKFTVEGKRPRMNIEQKGYRADPYHSYVVYFALNGNSTGNIDLDHIYQKVGQMARSAEFWSHLSRDEDGLFDEMVRLYDQRHPDAKSIGFFSDPNPSQE